jgi:hypothetical protein
MKVNTILSIRIHHNYKVCEKQAGIYVFINVTWEDKLIMSFIFIMNSFRTMQKPGSNKCVFIFINVMTLLFSIITSINYKNLVYDVIYIPKVLCCIHICQLCCTENETNYVRDVTENMHDRRY